VIAKLQPQTTFSFRLFVRDIIKEIRKLREYFNNIVIASQMTFVKQRSMRD